MKKSLPFILTIIFALTVFCGKSQSLRSLNQNFDEYMQENLQEKIYVHTDREFYLCGEILWFKAYCVDGLSHKPLEMSKVAYVEVLDNQNNAVLQAKIEMKEGFGEGSLFIPTTLGSGEYTFRAYTQWMRNFDPAFYFHKNISIVNSFRNLVKQPSQELKPDVQFFPEGGNLVAGLTSKVAFRAIDPEGKGLHFKGAILSPSEDTLAVFAPDKFGIGTFQFTPDTAAIYTAIVTDKRNNRYRYTLPKVHENGYVMQLKEEGEELKIGVASNQKILQNLQFLAHCRQEVTKSEEKMSDGGYVTFSISKSELKEGINHFTVFDQNGTPLCERLYFKMPENKINFQAAVNNEKFKTREKVSFEIKTADDFDVSLATNFSLSVYQLDSLNEKPNGGILHYLLLSSDLRGSVESPEFYFSEDIPEMGKYVDNLMLTHGWRRFKWEDVLQYEGAPKLYIPEYRAHIVRARLIHKLTGESIPNVNSYLSVPRSYVKLGADKSDEKGLLKFEYDDFFGPGDVYLQAHGGNDSLYSYELISPFSDDYSEFLGSDLSVNPSLSDVLESRSLGMQTRNVYLSKNLNRFVPPADTGSFYLKPDKTYFLDDYTRFTIMEDVMREYVPEVWVRIKNGRFYFKTLDERRNLMFETNPIIFFDGVPIFDINKLMEVDPLKVKKMEILTRKYFFGTFTFEGILSFTSYNGKFDAYPVDPNKVNILSYDGLQLKREFYQPGYDGSDDRLDRLPDFRNLLFWEPSLSTGSDGKAKIEFFTSDIAGNYLVVVEGITKDGLSGSGSFTFTVQKEIN